MVRSLPFTKMHGLGNDFVVLDETSLGEGWTEDRSVPSLARRICDRRFGVGADQILWLKKPSNPQCDIRMETVNADGSLAEMCGNGIRAVAVYLKRRSSITNGFQPHSFQIETGVGIKKVTLRQGPDGEDLVQVDMGPPLLGAGFDGGLQAGSPSGFSGRGETLTLPGEGEDDLCFSFYEVSMGNPHAVIFSDCVAEVPLEKWGPRIETHARFPLRTNVGWVEVKDSSSLTVRVWERGAGVTLACGTGACAAAVAALATGRVKGSVAVKLQGGTLKISWNGGPLDSVLMEGPAEEVFQGVLKLT